MAEGTLLMEDARVIFRNFAGKEGMYNREGDRNFCVLLEVDLAETLAADGWNVKTLRAREEGDIPQPYIQVSVGFKNRPPRIVLVTSRGRTDLAEGEVDILDWVDIANVDLIVRPYNWDVNGKTGVKAYVKSLFVTIEEDALELKYNDIPEVSAGPEIKAIGYDDGIIDAELVDEPLQIESLPSRSGRSE